MRTTTMQYRLLLLLELWLLGHHGILTSGCLEIEREALLTFKAGIIDTSNRLSSWAGRDCCSWLGVVCDNNTGHVVKLNLSNNYIYANWSDYSLHGEINSSLLVLTHLSSLDLSWNDFGRISIPKFIGSLKGLMHLDLSGSNFSGKIPSLLALTHLSRLDLSMNDFGGISIPKFICSLKGLMHLDLSYSNFSGKIPSLLALTHLSHLDLSWNDFGGISIPKFICSLKGLMHLDLSSSNFSGKIPEQLGNLTNLHYLDLSDSSFTCKIPLQASNLSHLQTLLFSDAFASNNPCIDNLSWLSQLSSIRVLDLSKLNLSNAPDWLEVVNTLHFLTDLYLGECSLTNIPTSLSHVNFTSLKFLDLRYNGPFKTTLSPWLSNFTKLSCLDLTSSGFHGKIPDSLGNLTSLSNLYLGYNDFDFESTMPRSIKSWCNLRVLDLSSSLVNGGDIAEFVGMLCSRRNLEELILGNNQLYGNLSSWLEEMKNLIFLDISNNSLVGPIPPGIGKLTNLQWLELSNNSLQGVISEAHLTSLSNLNVMALSFNSLSIDLDDNWVPPFQLWELMLGSCKLVGSQFPAWLRGQTKLEYLDLSNTNITGTVPEWFWNLSSTLNIDLSYNQLVGKLPVSLQFTDLEVLVLNSNRFEGPIPSLPKNLNILYLSENSLSGPLPLSLNISKLFFLSLSSNMFNGSIPSYVCELDSLQILNVSYNYLSGELPQCWGNSSLRILDLSNNNLTGKIPASVGLLSSLTSLHLNDNRFHGELPANLQHCKHLKFLDLSRNKLSGKIPIWIGENLQNLVILQLRSNMFSDSIPETLAQLPYLHVLDLAANNLSGPVPRCFGKFSAIIHPLANNYNPIEYKSNRLLSYNAIITINLNFGSVKFMDHVFLVMKGKEFQYSTILYLVKTIDVSGNNLSGEIPEEIVALRMLQSLNLSGNHLTGWIPEKIGDMLYLESLDLSLNELSGPIPQSLSDLTFLSHLNLSYNNLSGRIPTGSQLDRLNDPSIYIGNYYLCGPPTENSCSKDDANPSPQRDGNNGTETMWFYLGMGLGFATGLWGVYVVLLFRRSWRIAYFQMTDKLFDDIYVIVVLSWRRLSRKFGGQRTIS